MWSSCIYIPTSHCTIQYNLTSVTFTLSLQSLLPKVKPPPEISFHFLCSCISIGGYVSLRWILPPLGSDTHPTRRRAMEGNKIWKSWRTFKHKDRIHTDVPKYPTEKSRRSWFPADLLWRVLFFIVPKRVIKIRINVLLGQWVLIRFPFLY